MQSCDDIITFNHMEDPGIALRNFWPPETGFIWSSGKWCEITFSFDPGPKQLSAQADLILDVDVFKKEHQLDAQNVLVYLNGLRIASYLVQRRTTYFASFDPKLLKPSDNVLTLDTPDAVQPSTFGSSDTRMLGAQLFSLQIRRSE